MNVDSFSDQLIAQTVYAVQWFLAKENLAEIKRVNDLVWYQYSLITIIPLATFFFWRLFFPKDFSTATDATPIKPTIYDRFIQLFLAYGLVYYVIDLYQYIMQGKYGVCFTAYTMHHVISLIFLPSMIQLNYYNWWQLSVPLFHACLFYFNEYATFEYLYLGSVILFHFGIKSRVCKDLNRFKLAHKSLFFIYTAIIMMFLGNCRTA